MSGQYVSPDYGLCSRTSRLANMWREGGHSDGITGSQTGQFIEIISRENFINSFEKYCLPMTDLPG